MLINITYIQSTGIIRVVSDHKTIFSKEFEVDDNMYYSLMSNPGKYMIQNNSIVDYIDPYDDIDFLVTPTKHILIDISNHPIDNTVNRKAELTKIPEIDFLRNRVTMQIRIKHYRNDVHIPSEIPDKQITFTADNQLKREYPEGSGNMIGEYDMLVAAQDAGYKIWDLAVAEIHHNDTIGLLNEKCNYDS